MFFSKTFVTLLPALAVMGTPIIGPLLNKGSISQQQFDDLLFYYRYASSTYTDCPKPNGNTMVKQLQDSGTDTQGFVARDDTKKEVIVAWRGSSSAKDFLLTDASVLLKPYTSPGVDVPDGAMAHSGFLQSYNSVADDVIATVKGELDAHPGYTVVSTGHSLGGSLASLAGVSLKSNFPDVPMRLYTYGQPRTGNAPYAKLVNEQFGSNSFRLVRTIDGVPTAFPTLLGFTHHGVEYWQHDEPANAQNTAKCNDDGEDENCSAGIPSNGFTPIHLTYFGIHFDVPFCT